MANRVKKNPRTEFIICRATKDEKRKIIIDAALNRLSISIYTRKLMGFKEENE